MKPRQRLPQKQSARMFLRKHDHRDAIYDDKYHNAIWANTDRIDDKLVWVKYPKNAIIHQQTNGMTGWIDIDRQFNYAHQGFGQTYNITYYLEEPKITVMLCGYYTSSSKLYWTRDGIVWHDITPEGGLAFFSSWQILRFGENGVCNFDWNYQTHTYYIRKMFFAYDEDADEVTITTSTSSYASTYNSAIYLCNTQDGIIVFEGSNTGGNNPVFYTVYSHIKADGTRTTTEQSMSNRSILGTSARTIAYCKHSNHCAVLLWGERIHEQYTGRVEQCVEVMCTHDNGNTWHGQTISEVSEANSYYIGDNIDLFYRNGYFYAIYSVHVFGTWKTHLYKSQFGTSWEEVILPKWVDLPLLQGGGTGVATPASKETLRIAIDPLQTQNYDVSMNFLIPYKTQNLGAQNLQGGNFALGNILYQDGEITENDSFYYLMYGNGYNAYFDTEQFGDTSKAFSWQEASTAYIADTVQNGDYCSPT